LCNGKYILEKRKVFKYIKYVKYMGLIGKMKSQRKIKRR
jgi:hypothetical protein